MIGGWSTGALGLGGGVLFNPLLMSMGHQPKVAAATGMYMVIFSTGAATTIYIIMGTLNMQYGLWISAIVLVTTIIGMIFFQLFMNKLNR